MRTAHWITAAAAMVVGFSGCVSNEAAAPPVAADIGYGSEFGSIHGIVVDDSLLPVSGAIVTLVADGRATKTNSDGVFAITLVPVGEQRLLVEALGYGSIAANIQISAEQTTHVDLTMSRVATAEAYHVAKIGRGLFGCGETYRQGLWTVSGVPYLGGAFFGISACPNLSGDPDQDITWNTELSDNITLWRGAAFETEWRSTQAFGNGMVQDWAVTGCANNRNATFTRDTGPSPLREVLNAFQLDYRLNDLPNSSCNGDERCNLEGCEIMNRMFSWPSTFGQDSLFDIGITIQQTFTTYLTEFYRAEPPHGYSALPDA